MKQLAFALLLFSSAAFAEERILSFQSQVQISADGSLFVTETIEAQVEGVQIRRGILRDFPTDYHDRYGRKVTVPFEVLYVRRDGRGEPWSLAYRQNGISVRIGNANVLVPPGVHVFEIAYRTRYQLGFFADHDELYWNVNGNGWTFAMDQVSAEVKLAVAGTPAPASQIKVEAYTGPFGAKGRDYVAEALDGGARFETTRRLAAGEGLTIVFMFPKGIIASPTLREKFDRWFKDNRGEAFGGAVFLVFLAFLYWRWTAVGRDPRSGPVFPRYEAPQGLGPAGVRYLDKMECDDRCFASALLGLGQRGYLRIRERGGSYELERTGKTVEWLPGDAPVAALAPRQGVLSIGKAYDPAVGMARAGMALELMKHYDEKLFSKNHGSMIVGVMLAVATFFALTALKAATAVVVACVLVMAAVLWFAAKVLPAYTVEGRRLEDEVEGLRQYLSVAEKDDLARLKMPPRTKEEFAKFLPYAVALGVEKTWADAFAKVLGVAALAGAAAGYYSSSSDSGSMFSSPGDFVDSIADMGGTISAASTPPASSSGGSDSGGGGSSGGGGGSSGGGGGGGGGSGW